MKRQNIIRWGVIFWIFFAAVAGAFVGLVLFWGMAIWIFPDRIGYFEGDGYRYIPWAIISGAATIPSFILLWLWREQHRRKSEEMQEEDLEIKRKEGERRDLEQRSEHQRQFESAFINKVEGATLWESPALQTTAIGGLSEMRGLETLPAEYRTRIDHLTEGLLSSIKSNASPTIRRQIISLYLQGHVIDKARGLDMSHASLSGRRMIKKNLSSFILHHTDFTKANLKQCDFSGANLNWTDFTGAIVSEAIFDKASLQGAKFLAAHGILTASFSLAKYSTGPGGSIFPETFHPAEVGMIRMLETPDGGWVVDGPTPHDVFFPFDKEQDALYWLDNGATTKIVSPSSNEGARVRSHALQVITRKNTNGAIYIWPHGIKVGSLVTASVEFLCPPGRMGRIHLGDGRGQGSSGNAAWQERVGNGEWQRLQVSLPPCL